MQLLVAADVSDRLRDSIMPAIVELADEAIPEVTVLHVVHAASAAWSPEELEQVLADRRAALEELLQSSKFTVNLLVETLPYGEEIPSYIAHRANDLNVDAVVVCSKHATGVFAGILGSVAQGLLRESDVPVIVVRPVRAEDDPEGDAAPAGS